MGAVLAVLAIGSVGALELSVESGDIKTPITVSWSGSPQRAFDWFAVYDTANFNENGGTLDGIGMGWTMHYVYADTPAFSTDGEVWAYAATLPGEATFSVDTPGEYYFVYFCCDAYEIVNATKITVTAPSYAIFSVVKNRLLPRIDVEVNLPLAPDMEPGGWGEPLKAEMLNKDMHATMADWIWVWGPDADYSSNDMLNAFHGSSDSPGYMSDAFQGMYANIVPFEQCWFYVGHGGETYEERYNIVQGQTVSCGPAYDTGYGAIQDSGIGYARFSIVVPSAGIYSVGVFSESFSEPWPKMYWRDVVFCGLDFAASANSVVAGAEFAIDVIRQQWVPGCGINANEENEMLTFNVYSLPTESESCDAICRDVVPAPVQQSLPIVKSELRWLALPESNLTVRLHRAAQYVLVVEDAPSATEFARFDLSVTPARAYARRTLATGLPTELRAGVSYTVSIDPYDVFGNAVVADDGDLLARLKVCPTEWLTGTERQPNGTYVITLTMPDAAAYARHDVRIQLREGAYAAGGSSRRLAHDRDDLLPDDWDGVDVAGSPMAILVTDAQGRFSPEASEEGDDGGAATVAVAVGVTLAVLFAVALGWIYRRNRAAHNLLKLLKSQNSLPPTPSQLEALAASLGAQALPDALRRLQVGSDELALGRLLGSGAFAEVRLADWRGTPIAVKRLLRTRHTTEGLKAFKHEAALHASLRHPNIVGLLGFCVDMAGGEVCLLLELCGKGTLEHLLRKAATSLSWAAHKLPIAIGVARAMAYLHAQEPPVIHRDLKCANVLVDDGYNAKLCDFGLSRERNDDATMSTTGTPLYSAPELLRRERYDEKVDVWSFGCLLESLATHRQTYALHEGASFASKPSRVAEGSLSPGLSLSLAGERSATCFIAAVIEQCAASGAPERPSFVELLETLQSADLHYLASLQLPGPAGPRIDDFQLPPAAVAPPPAEVIVHVGATREGAAPADVHAAPFKWAGAVRESCKSSHSRPYAKDEFPGWRLEDGASAPRGAVSLSALRLPLPGTVRGGPSKTTGKCRLKPRSAP